MLRVAHFIHNQLTDGGKLVSPKNQLRFTPQKYIIILLLVLISVSLSESQALVWTKGLGKLKNCRLLAQCLPPPLERKVCDILSSPLSNTGTTFICLTILRNCNVCFSQSHFNGFCLRVPTCWNQQENQIRVQTVSRQNSQRLNKSTRSIRKSWQSLRRQAAVARSV
jgi:hypothetical protein